MPRATIRTGVPGGVCRSAFSTSARPIWSTRSWSPSASSPSAPSASSSWSRRRATAANSSRRSEATSASSTGSTSIRNGPASSRERSSRSVASFESRSTCSVIVSRNSRRVASSSSSSRKSSRKPPREKIGVRSSWEAFAMNSRRASSRRASWSRIRSNAPASCPTSSRPWSSTGCSKSPDGDALGRLLEPPQPPREDGGGGEPGQKRDRERDQARIEQARPDERRRPSA